MPSIEIVTRFPAGLPPVRVDPNQLEMALLNLAVNARDAMPASGTITISAHQEEMADGNGHGLPPGAYVCVSVSDTGMGMDAATLARAIEPFFTTKGVGKGTGLGLSMIHGLAVQSGGTLTLKSQVGKGTTAEIWLPRGEAVTRSHCQRRASPSGASHLHGASGRGRSAGDDRDGCHAGGSWSRGNGGLVGRGSPENPTRRHVH